MANYQIKTPTLFESFETIGDWTIGGTANGSENINSTAGQFSEGSGGLRLVTAGGASSNRFATKTINQSFAAHGVMSVDVYVPDVTKINGVTFYLSEDSTFTNYYSFAFTGSTMRNGLNRCTLYRNGWTRNGTPSLHWGNAMIRFRCRVDAASNQVGDVTFDNFQMGRYNRPKFIFRFDDGWDDHYDIAKPIMDAFGFKGVAAIISDSIGTANYMTLSELRELFNAGWDIANHTHTHTNLSTLTQAEQLTEYETCRDFIRDNGLDRKGSATDLVFPFGGNNADTLTMMQANDTKSAHTILSPRSMSYPLDNFYVTIDNIVNTTTLQSAKDRVDRAIAEGACVVFLFHLLPDSTTVATEWARADFEALCKYLYQKRSQIDVVTWTEFLAGMNQ